MIAPQSQTEGSAAADAEELAAEDETAARLAELKKELGEAVVDELSVPGHSPPLISLLRP